MKFYLSFRNPRILLAFLHDVSAAGMAWILAYFLRFNLSPMEAFAHDMWLALPWVLMVQTGFFLYFGLYQGIWRFASIQDLKRILLAVGLSGLVVAALIPFLRLPILVPRSVLVIDPLLLVLMMGGSRFFYRAWKEHKLYGVTQKQGKPVLVLGAGEAAAMLLSELSRNSDWQVVGLLDDNPELHHRSIHGVRVLGFLKDIAHWREYTGATHAIVAMPSSSHPLRKQVLDMCIACGMETLTVPSFDDLVSGRINISQVRPVELEDLLGREPVYLDSSGLAQLLEDQVILVTGAGGSIGSELCRQIARYQPAMMVFYELGEYALYALEQEFQKSFPEIRTVSMVGDVKNAQRVNAVLACYRPAVVFHAAAYKHVPLMENDNVSEALRNNVLGTYTLAAACKSHRVGKFVLVSTDKAVNPTNIMGASKRLAEMVCQGLQEPGSTQFVIVRFGNVLGSSGSVIPKFREQIAGGGPVTVTHPEVTRFFMSIPEAAQLVIQAGFMGKGGEIYVLDMGQPVRIVDLAREMIRLSGFRDGEIAIVYSGLRPGEKLYEELLADKEYSLPTPHEKIRVAQARQVEPVWVERLMQWVELLPQEEEKKIKDELKTWIEDYLGDVHAVVSSTAGKPVMMGSTVIH